MDVVRPPSLGHNWFLKSGQPSKAWYTLNSAPGRCAISSHREKSRFFWTGWLFLIPTMRDSHCVSSEQTLKQTLAHCLLKTGSVWDDIRSASGCDTSSSARLLVVL